MNGRGASTITPGVNGKANSSLFGVFESVANNDSAVSSVKSPGHWAF